LVSSRALPNIVKIEYGPISVVSFMQLLFEGSNLDEFRKIERLCAIEGITFVKTVEDAREMEAEAGSWDKSGRSVCFGDGLGIWRGTDLDLAREVL
jgi:hypothetical protein